MEVKQSLADSRPALPPISSLTEDRRYTGRESRWSPPSHFASSSRHGPSDADDRNEGFYQDPRGWDQPRQGGLPSFPRGFGEDSHRRTSGPNEPEDRSADGKAAPEFSSSKRSSLSRTGPGGSHLGKRSMAEPQDPSGRSAPRGALRSPPGPDRSLRPQDPSFQDDAYGPHLDQRRTSHKLAPSLPTASVDKPWSRSAEGSPTMRMPGPPQNRDDAYESHRLVPSGYPGRPGGDYAEHPRFRPQEEEVRMHGEARGQSWREWDGPPPIQHHPHTFASPYQSNFHHLVKPERPEADPAALPPGRRRGTSGGYVEGPHPPGSAYVGQHSRSPVPPFASPRHQLHGHPQHPGYSGARDGPMPGPIPVPPPLARPASTVGTMTVPGGAPGVAGPPTAAAAAATPSTNRRVAHLLSEQRRRESINTGFEDLRQALPACRDGQDSKATVLRRAVEYIHELESIIQQSHLMRAGNDGVGFDPRSPSHDHDHFGDRRAAGRDADDPRRNSGGRGGGERRATASSTLSDDRSMMNGIPGPGYRREATGYPGDRRALPDTSPGAPPLLNMRAAHGGESTPLNGWIDPTHGPELAPRTDEEREYQLAQALKRSNSDPEERDIARVRRKLSEQDSLSQYSVSSINERELHHASRPSSRRSIYGLPRDGDRHPEGMEKPVADSHGLHLRSGHEAHEVKPDDEAALPRRTSNSIFIERRA